MYKQDSFKFNVQSVHFIIKDKPLKKPSAKSEGYCQKYKRPLKMKMGKPVNSYIYLAILVSVLIFASLVSVSRDLANLFYFF